ncbi:serine/threonine-protein kinase [Frankia sp. Ag45/Mut15]|uniref:non-specific serine/threonine protein kinase n=1 Tax=Frankia umida TaxID=573489 RepID=A0ABT0K5E7_9ACTN|nr:serine/threonine-protein kinase [Frankia umida]MCK9879019.1 serine/threonine-protein kinase [Frankia umida]
MIIDRERVAAALPGYTLGRQLGSGTFGVVLAAEHRLMAAPVAVKVMQTHPGENTQVESAVEARLLRGLDHPHVVRVFDYVEQRTDDEGTTLCVIVMELLAGGTLTRRRPRFGPEQACAVGLAVAGALAHAHQNKVLHRDIKRDNILFTADGMPKVTDFGIAKLLEGTAATVSKVVGTPLYMAPEQFEAGHHLGPATDLYALGGVLYRLLCGRSPFSRDQPPDALRRQQQVDLPPPMTEVPAPLAAVVLRALAKDPANRQADAHTFALDLADAATSVYGTGWTTATGLRLHLDDAVREATVKARRAQPPPPPSPPPSPASSSAPPFPPSLLALSSVVARLARAVTFTWDALSAQHDLLAQRERILGRDHPDALSTAYELAELLDQRGEREQARDLFEDVLIRRRRALGAQHADTRTSADSLATVLTGLHGDATALDRGGDRVGACQLFEDVLARRRRVLGEDHIDTLTSAHRAAVQMGWLGRRGDARRLLADVLARRRRVLGEDHPDTLATAHWLAFELVRAGEAEQAQRLFADVLARRRRVLGESHPDTRATADELTAEPGHGVP